MLYSVGPNAEDEEGQDDAEASGPINPQADDITMHVPLIPSGRD